MEILQFIKEGGFIMYPLFICSILIWAVAFEKFWFFSQITKQFDQVFTKSCDLLEQNKFNEAKGLCHNVHPLIQAPYEIVFEKQNYKKDLWEQAIARRLSETQMGMKRFLWILATIATIAPFLGLFGTVVGIMRSFHSMALSGKSGFAVIAGGLSESLVATAAGILVAIVAVCFYNYFLVRLNHINLEFKNRIEDLLDLMAD